MRLLTQSYLSKTLKEIRHDIVSEVAELLPQNFLKFNILKSICSNGNSSERYPRRKTAKKKNSLNPPSASKHGQDAFAKTTTQIQCEVKSLEDDIQLAQAKLHSLEEIPSYRPWYGRANFTCTNCHFKGQKVLKPCTLPTCGGYNECGILAMHSDHKVEINKAKKEIKTLTKS